MCYLKKNEKNHFYHLLKSFPKNIISGNIIF